MNNCFLAYLVLLLLEVSFSPWFLHYRHHVWGFSILDDQDEFLIPVIICFPSWTVIFRLGRPCHQSRGDLQSWYQLWHQVGQVEIFERITISIQKCNPTAGPLVSWRVPPSKSRLRFCWRHQLPCPLQLHHSNQVLQMFSKKWESDPILPSAFTSLWNCKECSAQYSSHGTASFTIRKIFLSFVPHPNLGLSKKLAFFLSGKLLKRC